MREIKFRLWDKYKNKMIYSDSDLSNNVHLYMNGCVAWNGVWITNEVELMQFTGLHDKNGKEIYEGDIVKYRSWNNNFDGKQFSTQITNVEFINGSFYPIYENFECEDDYYSYGIDEIEIISNIHENPEILCDHTYDNTVLLSYPAKKLCNKCGYTELLESK